MSNRHPITKFFITFPQSGEVSKCALYESIKSIVVVSKCVVVAERHADGSPHLHAIVATKHDAGIPRGRFLKALQAIYPLCSKRLRVESMRNWQASVSYLLEPAKDKYVDPSPLLFGNVNSVNKDDPEKHLRELYFEIMDKPIRERGAAEVRDHKIRCIKPFPYTDQDTVEEYCQSPLRVARLGKDEVV